MSNYWGNTRFFYLNHADAADIKTDFQSYISIFIFLTKRNFVTDINIFTFSVYNKVAKIW